MLIHFQRLMMLHSEFQGNQAPHKKKRQAGVFLLLYGGSKCLHPPNVQIDISNNCNLQCLLPISEFFMLDFTLIENAQQRLQEFLVIKKCQQRCKLFKYILIIYPHYVSLHRCDVAFKQQTQKGSCTHIQHFLALILFWISRSHWSSLMSEY